jgi:hypothetical protein
MKKDRPFSKADYWNLSSVVDMFGIGHSDVCNDDRCRKKLEKYRRRVGWGRECLNRAVEDELAKILGKRSMNCFGPYGGRTVPWKLGYLGAVPGVFRGLKPSRELRDLREYRYPACDLWIQDSRIIDDLLPAADAAELIRLINNPWYCATCWFGFTENEDGEEIERKRDAVGLLISLWKIGRAIQGDHEEIKVIFQNVPAVGKELRRKEIEFYEYRLTKILKWRIRRKASDSFH